MATLVILDSLAEDTLVYETGQVDTLVWDTIEFTIVSGVDLCDLTGFNSAISIIGVSPKIELIGEMFSIFINAAHLRFDGLGILFNGEFTVVKSVANLLGFYSWLNGNSKQADSLIESNKGEFIVIGNKMKSEVSGEKQVISILAQPNNEC